MPLLTRWFKHSPHPTTTRQKYNVVGPDDLLERIGVEAHRLAAHTYLKCETNIGNSTHPLYNGLYITVSGTIENLNCFKLWARCQAPIARAYRDVLELEQRSQQTTLPF